MRWAPTPGMSELFERTDAQIIAKTRQVGHCTIAVENKKGGAGKSTTAEAIAATLATITHRPTVIVDANPDGGDAARFAGVATITVQELYKRLSGNATLTPVDLAGEDGIASSRHGVFVIGHDRNVKPENRFGRDRWDKVMDFLEAHYEFIVLDMGTSITGDGDLLLLKERANVLILPATIKDMESSIEDMVETCVRMREFGVAEAKIATATGVFSNGNPRHHKDYLAEAVMRGDPPELEVLEEFPGDTFVVRPSRYLRGGYMKKNGLRLNKLSRKVRLDYRLVLLHVLEIAIELQTASRSESPRPS